MKAKKIFLNKYFIGIILLFSGLLLGWIFFHNSSSNKELKPENSVSEQTIWTCSMHPQIRMDKPGQCPICGMDLIPLQNSDATVNIDAIEMSESAMKLAEVQTSIVARGSVIKEIRLYGKIQADERLLQTQTAYFPGRIEQLLVNVTGEKVSKGQLIARIYSPELVTAQKELIEAVNLSEKYPAIFDATREKLHLWKLTDKQIESIEKSGTIITAFDIYATTSGILVSRKVSTGDYVNKGDALYDVADLSKVWGVFDAYESDLSWISLGENVEYTAQAIPGKVFKGNVSFIDPVIDPITRVTRVRIEIANYNMQFKPEMFLNGIIQSRSGSTDEQLTIPQSAVLWTGTRSIVYVKLPDAYPPAFKMQEVTLGASLKDSYVIINGLTEGEEIVTNGTFSVDAAAQLAGKPSMMNQVGKNQTKPVKTGMDMENINVNPKFKEQMTQVFKEYLKMKDAFVKSDQKSVSTNAQLIKTALKNTDMTLLKGDIHIAWMEQLKVLNETVKAIAGSSDIEFQRSQFIQFNDTFYKSLKTFGLSNTTAYYQFCPMANKNKGAYWFNNSKEIKNPYFGDKMLKCGKNKEIIK